MLDKSIIVAAIITAIGTLLGAVLGVYKDVIISVFSKRGRRVSGTWERQATYWATNDPEEKFKRAFICELHQRGTKIVGKLSSTSRATDDLGATYSVEGKSFETEFITLSVVNKESDMINYATSILKFSKGGREMLGDLVGRSRKLDGIVLGKLTFTKISDVT